MRAYVIIERHPFVRVSGVFLGNGDEFSSEQLRSLRTRLQDNGYDLADVSTDSVSILAEEVASLCDEE
jgi:hypothetical protein